MHALWGGLRLMQLAALDGAACRAAAARAVAACPQPARVLDLADGPVWSLLCADAGALVECVERRPLEALSRRVCGDRARVLGESEGWAPPGLVLLEPWFLELRDEWSGAQVAEMARRRAEAEARGLCPLVPQLPRLVCRLCLLECAELWARHGAVTTVCGLDLGRFERWAAPSRVRSLELWQWRYALVGGPVDWADLPRPAAAAADLEVPASGVCHAVCAWVDFDFGGAWQRTGPGTCFPQGVVFLPEPVVCAGRVRVRIELDPLHAEVELQSRPRSRSRSR